MTETRAILVQKAKKLGITNIAKKNMDNLKKQIAQKQKTTSTKQQTTSSPHIIQIGHDKKYNVKTIIQQLITQRKPQEMIVVHFESSDAHSHITNFWCDKTKNALKLIKDFIKEKYKYGRG